MIVRKQPNGELILVGQTDHSRLVGQLAAHWGSRHFASLEPYESVVRAATFHDYGWLRYETSPLIDPETGEPYWFLQLPLGATQLEAYQWSLDWLAQIDPYSGLLINMHRTGLWKARYETITHPMGYNLGKMSPEIRNFIERNEAWQGQQRETQNYQNLWTNYRLMQVWDLLGLYFCCQEPYQDHIDPVPVSYSNESGVRLTMKPVASGQIAFEPYPFDTRPCHVQLAFKRLTKTSFESLEVFRKAYFQAENGLMRFELV